MAQFNKQIHNKALMQLKDLDQLKESHPRVF